MVGLHCVCMYVGKITVRVWRGGEMFFCGLVTSCMVSGREGDLEVEVEVQERGCGE